MVQTTGEPIRQVFSDSDKRLWLDVLEGLVAGVSLFVASLYPLWHALRGMFGLSLLFHGEDFATLAFHMVVFRISGWKKVSTSKAMVFTRESALQKQDAHPLPLNEETNMSDTSPRDIERERNETRRPGFCAH